MPNKILVSAGHSTVPPRDSGATGNGFIEAVEALKVRDAVAALLRLKNIDVIMDGIDGESEPLRKAIRLARTANVAIEFHFNAGGPGATGIEVLALPAKKALSQKIAKAIGDATGLVLRGDGGWKNQDSGQHKRLGFCMAGGIIVEICFISSASDMQSYQGNFHLISQGVAEVLASA
jgi:N-acetylmuramoyl-L-alanine amidase